MGRLRQGACDTPLRNLGYALQDLWYEGARVPVARPLSHFQSHSLYKGSSPIFVTTKLSDLKRLQEAAAPDPVTGLPLDFDASMLLRRLKVYSFHVAVEHAERFDNCAHCFANLILGRVQGIEARRWFL